MATPLRSCARTLADRLTNGETLRVLLIGAAGSGKTGVINHLRDVAGERGITLHIADPADRADESLVSQLTATILTGSESVIVGLRSVSGSSPTVAPLVEALVLNGNSISLGALDDDELANGIAVILNAPPADELVQALRRLGGGDPAITRVIVQGWQADGLLERGRFRSSVASTPPPPTAVRQLVSARLIGLDDGERVWLAAAALAPEFVPPFGTTGSLTSRALLTAELRPVPAVADVVMELMSVDHRFAATELAASWCAGEGREDAAAVLWARLRSTSDQATRAYIAAADLCRTSDPVRAAEWYALAASSNLSLRGVLASTTALAGDIDGAKASVEAALNDNPREPSALATAAALAARVGGWRQVAERSRGIANHPSVADGTWPVIAELAMIAAAEPQGASAAHTPASASGDRPDATLPSTELIRRAADLMRRTASAAAEDGRDIRRDLATIGGGLGPIHSWLDAPFSPHEWVAAMFLAMGDGRGASNVLAPFAATPALGVAHGRAAWLKIWADLRCGQPPPSNRPAIIDPVLEFAVRAAVARRTGDVREGGEVAALVAGQLSQVVLDPLNLDAALELFIAARRFGPRSFAADMTERLDDVIEALPSPMWRIRYHWAQLEGALAAQELEATDAPIDALSRAAEWVSSARPLAQAAIAWRNVAAGRPNTAEVEAAVGQLNDVALSWEAAQLAGQAAIRVDDAGSARQLLVRARSLRGAGEQGDRTVTPAGLSDREAEVGALVLEGLTHKEIGERLYISPKTVEHHVAHIRTKLGVTTRPEFVAALRHDLAN